ncbi:MAG: DUF192 domain-containing protein, partial [Myxococcota bacterium]
IALTLCLSLILGSCSTAPGGVEVTIRGVVIQVELANTLEKRERGLSGRPSLDPDRGMLFLFAEPGFPGFWMPDMRFDLDLVWIRDARVVDLSEFVSRREPQRMHRPREAADAVLEVLAGTVSRHGWRRGDRVTFDPPELPRPR